MSLSKNKRKSIGNAEQGIAILESINENDNTVFAHKKYIKFSKELLPEFECKFLELKKLSIINESCDFNDNEWFGISHYNNKYLRFKDFEYNKELTLALKSFVVIELYDRGISIALLADRISLLIKVIKKFNYFRGESVDDFEDYIIEKQNNNINLAFLKSAIEPFLFYYSMGEYSEYLNILSYINTNNDRYVREIPNYRSIVWFDYLINDFMNNFNEHYRVKYYPIYLWWKITSVIPLRPIEFIHLENNCCFMNNKDKSYILKVPRKKRRKKFYRKKSLEIIDKLKTNKEIYQIIEDYKNLIEIDSDDKYLFPLRVYKNHIAYSNKRTLKEKLNYDDMTRLLYDFYEEIIKNHYGINVLQRNTELNEEGNNGIVKLKLGDTRHLAFCSMMLQGFNPLTIAQMGGHQQLETQTHYSYHLDEFIESYTIMLSKYLKYNELKSDNSFHDKYTTSEKIDLIFRYEGKKEERNIENGRCYSTNFPNDCYYEECIDCQYFSIDIDKLDKSILNDYSKYLENTKKQVRAKVNFLKRYYQDIIKDGSIDTVKMECNKTVESDLQRHGRQLKNLINREANLISKLEQISINSDKKNTNSPL